MAGAVRARRKAERPGEILEAAFEEFVQKGYAATRLEDVAVRAGVTKGTIYFYFENKEQVFVAMVHELSRPLHAEIQTFLANSSDSAPDFLRSYLRLFYQIMVSDRHARELQRLLIAEAARFPKLLDEHYQDIMGPVIERLQKALRIGAERREIRDAPLQSFPEMILAPALSLNISMLLFGDRKPMDPARHFEAAIDLLLNGLLPRTDETGQQS